MATSLDLSRTYTSYSGVDIKVIVNGAPIGSMQALSYAIQREKAPIYVMGSVDPVSYSRGKRGIAGTMISLMMDVHLIYSKAFDNEKYYGDTDELRPVVKNTLTNLRNAPSDAGDNAGAVDINRASELTSVPRGENGVETYLRNDVTNYKTDKVFDNYEAFPVHYVDQILPFDVTIVAANEYGQTAQMRLYGCEILNEGSGFSIDDIVIENQMTYVCRTILPWRTIDNPEATTMYTNLQATHSQGEDGISGGRYK